MTGVRGIKTKLQVAMAAAAILVVPAIALATTSQRPAAVAVSFDRITAFTPASADPRLAAAFASRGASIDDFKFTPAAAKGRPSQIRIAVRARSLAPTTAVRPVEMAVAPMVTAITPAAFSLGAAVGWKRFALSGDVSKVTSPDSVIGDRKSAIVGVSYNLNKFTGRVALGADRGTGRIAALTQPDNVSLDVGAAYNLNRRIALTGGVRYRVDQDRAATLADQRRDSQAVYVGTAFKF